METKIVKYNEIPKQVLKCIKKILNDRLILNLVLKENDLYTTFIMVAQRHVFRHSKGYETTIDDIKSKINDIFTYLDDRYRLVDNTIFIEDLAMLDRISLLYKDKCKIVDSHDYVLINKLSHDCREAEKD